jgi:tetratricopeptide (TPR) repeat protein
MSDMHRLLGLLVIPILLDQSPSDFDTYLAAGKAALQQGRYAEAENQLRKTVEDEKLRASDPARFAEALETLSHLDLVIGRSAEAILLERRAVETMERAANIRK